MRCWEIYSLFGVGGNFLAETEGSLKALDIGAHAKLMVGRDADIDNLGREARVEIGQDLTVKGEIGGESVVETSRDLHVGTIAREADVEVGRDAVVTRAVVETARVSAGRNITAEVVGAATLVAGRDVLVEVACSGAYIKAGRNADIQITENDVTVIARKASPSNIPRG